MAVLASREPNPDFSVDHVQFKRTPKGHLRATATNGRLLLSHVWDDEEVEKAKGKEYEANIPGEVLRKAVHALGKQIAATANESSKQATGVKLKAGRITFEPRCSTVFAPWEKHLPKDFKGYTALAVNGAYLAQLLEVMAGLDPEFPTVILCLPAEEKKPLLVVTPEGKSIGMIMSVNPDTDRVQKLAQAKLDPKELGFTKPAKPLPKPKVKAEAEDPPPTPPPAPKPVKPAPRPKAAAKPQPVEQPEAYEKPLPPFSDLDI